MFFEITSTHVWSDLDTCSIKNQSAFQCTLQRLLAFFSFGSFLLELIIGRIITIVRKLDTSVITDNTRVRDKLS